MSIEAAVEFLRSASENQTLMQKVQAVTSGTTPESALTGLVSLGSAHGHHFSASELIELAQKAAPNRELDSEELNAVVGGFTLGELGLDVQLQAILTSFFWPVRR